MGALKAGCDIYCQCGSHEAAAGLTGNTGSTLDFFPEQSGNFSDFEELNCQNNGGVSFEPLLSVVVFCSTSINDVMTLAAPP